MANTWVTELTADYSAKLHAFLHTVSQADGRPLVPGTRALPDELRGGQQYFIERGEELVGYAHVGAAQDTYGRTVAEAFVHPEHRGAGVGTELVGALQDKAGIASGSRGKDRLRIWSHGDHPAAARIAERAGFSRARELLRMRLDLRSAQLDQPQLPEGARLRTFVPGSDEHALIEVNRRAFAWHPEQAGLSVADLLREENADWFDAAGFFLAERSAQLLGFHWTKVHDGVVADPDGGPVGEVYVLGVDPGAQGGGLGRALTLAGLRHLREQGLRKAMLYVESTNTAAVRVYERLGFRVWDTDVQYSH